MAVAAVGTISYGRTLLDAGSETARTFTQMNSHNLAESKESVKATLGPVIFDTALMTAAGMGAASLADHLPTQAPKAQLAASLDLAKEAVSGHVQDLFRLGENSMTPAFAGTGPLRGDMFSGGHDNLAEGLKAIWAKPKESQTMAMSVSDGSGGGGGRSQVGGDGITYRTARGLNGENLYMVDLPAGRTANVTDASGAVTSVGSDGKIMVGFTTGEGRQLDLGQNIRRLVMTEHTNGLKQFTFNDKVVADLEVEHARHAVRAVLPGGDHLHMMDNVRDSFTHFAHNDGLQTWVENSGRVVIQLPAGAKVHQVQIPDKIGYIRMVEKADGGKEFRFLNNSGAPIAQRIELPPTPQLAAIKTADEALHWHDLQKYLSSRAMAQQTLHQDLSQQGGGGVYRVDPGPGGALNYHNHASSPSNLARMMRIQPTYERAVAHEMGVPYNIMRGNDLSAPADMELAMQNHGWLVTSYLDRLDHQDSVYGGGGDHHGGW